MKKQSIKFKWFFEEEEFAGRHPTAHDRLYQLRDDYHFKPEGPDSFFGEYKVPGPIPGSPSKWIPCCGNMLK